jgi:hypothetical protein
MYQAICQGCAGSNCHLLGNALLIGRWASSSPTRQVLDQFRNDLELLLADDLSVELELPLMAAESVRNAERNLKPARSAHDLLGMGAFAHQMGTRVEAIVASDVIRSCKEHSQGMLLDQVRSAPVPRT